jgi:hypothetical protein
MDGFEYIALKLVNGHEVLTSRVIDENGDPVTLMDVVAMWTTEELEQAGFEEEDRELVMEEYGNILEFFYPIQAVQVAQWNERTKKSELRTSFFKYHQFSDDNTLVVDPLHIISTTVLNVQSIKEYVTALASLYNINHGNSVH